MENNIKDLSFNKLFNENKESFINEIVEIDNNADSKDVELELKGKDFNKEVKSDEILEEERLTVNISKEIKIPNIRAKELIIKQIKLWYETGEDIVIADKIFHLAANGLLRKDIKKTLKINMNLWNEMVKSNHSIYYDAIIRGEILGVGEVVDAAKSIAVGYDYVEVKKGTRNGKPFHEVHKRHLPPNFNAIKYYLENKLGSEWGSKLDININNNTDNVLTIEDLQKLPKDVLQSLLEFKQEEKDKARNVVSVQ